MVLVEITESLDLCERPAHIVHEQKMLETHKRCGRPSLAPWPLATVPDLHSVDRYLSIAPPLKCAVGENLPKRRPQADDEPFPRPSHHQHCLYLLAEAERIIDRTAAKWPIAEVDAVKSRLKQIAEKLTGASART